ncbi:MAG: DUF4113 domain-containing protein [Candidatus Paceibacterota bacterium]
MLDNREILEANTDKIGVLDCNNFFVSCERLFRPDLREKPVLVLSSDEGCVVARSQEVKDMGIAMGVPYFHIKDIIKDRKIVTFPANFALYKDIAKRVFVTVEGEVGKVERYSIDECFFKTDFDFKEMIRVKNKVERHVGVPVSIGVASSKTQAKYVNKISKKTKTGVEVWSMKTWKQRSEKIKLSELWGVGQDKVRMFNDYGLVTVKDLFNVSKRQLNDWFGVFGVRLQDELMGEIVFPINFKKDLQKSIMNSRSFSQSTNDINDLKEAIKYHVFKCVSTLYATKLEAKILRISIKPSFNNKSLILNSKLEVILNESTRDLFTLTKEAINLLEINYKPSIQYKKAGVMLSGLVVEQEKTNSLFPIPDNTKNKAELTNLLFSVNQKNRQDMLRLGSLPDRKKRIWLNKKDRISPAYTTDWQKIKIVH